MIKSLVEVDKKIFLFFNSKNAEWLDPLMLAFSSYTMWTLVFILFGVLILFKAGKHRTLSVVFYMLSVGLSTLLTNVLKLVVQRPRPIHEKEWQGVIHDIEEFSDAYSFFSSHSATTFCIATFVLLFFRKQKTYGYLAFAWASGVAYSRIYVGKHYPGDVLVGILFGIVVGYLGFRMMEKYIAKRDRLIRGLK